MIFLFGGGGNAINQEWEKLILILCLFLFILFVLANQDRLT